MGVRVGRAEPLGSLERRPQEEIALGGGAGEQHDERQLALEIAPQRLEHPVLAAGGGTLHMVERVAQHRELGVLVVRERATACPAHEAQGGSGVHDRVVVFGGRRCRCEQGGRCLVGAAGAEQRAAQSDPGSDLLVRCRGVAGSDPELFDGVRPGAHTHAAFAGERSMGVGPGITGGVEVPSDQGVFVRAVAAQRLSGRDVEPKPGEGADRLLDDLACQGVRERHARGRIDDEETELRQLVEPSSRLVEGEVADVRDHRELNRLAAHGRGAQDRHRAVVEGVDPVVEPLTNRCRDLADLESTGRRGGSGELARVQGQPTGSQMECLGVPLADGQVGPLGHDPCDVGPIEGVECDVDHSDRAHDLSPAAVAVMVVGSAGPDDHQRHLGAVEGLVEQDDRVRRCPLEVVEEPDRGAVGQPLNEL